ncbi:MAG: glycosyltransferase [Lachnospiraceae bacterium]|nr:glycosyltransferase [Lachnospiraceae bacterium]
MKKDVAIVFGITKNYTFALANVLIGMKKHCKKFWNDIIVYHDGISEADKQALSKIVSCTFIDFVPRISTENVNDLEATKKYSLLALSKFECFDLLTQYHKIIWHDVDILVQKDFSDLLLYGDKSGYAATQSESFRMEQNFYGSIDGYEMLRLLYNSGILVLSDKLIGFESFRNYCYNTFNHYAERLRYNDQAVLNLMIQDFNIDVELIDIDKFCCHPTKLNYQKASIIHAYGGDKFWNSTRLKRQFPEWGENNKLWEQEKWQGFLSSPKCPLVSVLMTVYERTDYLSDSVSSILNQDYTNFEFIIVVEKSQFQKAIVRELQQFYDQRIKVICNDKKLGFAESLNVGIRSAAGNYIARMDDDDISLPERLYKEVAYMEGHPEISVVGGWIKFFGQYAHEEHRPENTEELKVWSIKESPLFHPTVMIRTEILKQHSFFYDSQWFTEDYDLWLRMMEKVKIANIPEVVLLYRASGQNATARRAERVMQSHLDLMRRTMSRSLNLEFTRDEMHLLRQPSIIHECYNSDEMQKLRDSVLYRIYEANREKQVFDQSLLEQYLGEVKYDFKTEAKLRLKKYPKIYQYLRKFYRWVFRKDTTIPHEYSLLTRIKMRILPPSSKSFHKKMDEAQSLLEQQQAMISQVAEQNRVLQFKIDWMDKVLRRMFQENQAGFWGLYQKLPEGTLRNELSRKEQYSDYISALYILRELGDRMRFKTIHSLDKHNVNWLAAAENLHLFDQAGAWAHTNGVNNQDDCGYELAIGSHSVTEDVSVDYICEASPIILYYLAQSENDNQSWKQMLPLALERCKNAFREKGYVYFDLRSKVRENWEISEQYAQSVSLFVQENLWDEVSGLLTEGILGEYEII